MLKWKNKDMVIRRMREAIKRIDSASKKAVPETTEHVYKESQQEVPVLTGALRASAEMDFNETSNTATGQVKYQTPYAHKIHETETQYLLQPTMRARRVLKQNIKENTRDALKSIKGVK